MVPSERRWATDGMRLARAVSTEEALRTAYSSSVRPPESINTTRAPARYWSSSAEDWAQLVVSGLLWLGVPLVWGVSRVLRAEVK